MKYAIIIPDGAADGPIGELGDRTPLQAARTPHMDRIAIEGKIGTVRTVPAGLSPGSDVAILSLMGYDPRAHYTGRAPLEAAAQGLTIAPDEWVLRCNLVTIVEGVMEDYSAGHISTEEARQLIEQVQQQLGSDQARFYTGVGYRHLLTLPGPLDVQTTPPHDILGQPVARHLPSGPGSDRLIRLMQASQDLLAEHEINAVRRDLGENLATSIWLWGQGQMPTLEPFEGRFGLRAAVITAVDLVRGIATLVGMDRIEVPGATGYIDTNYAGKGQAAIEALKTHDLVVVHVEAPDECGHNAQARLKTQSLEDIDRHIVGPILEHLESTGDDWRILVSPDHPTPCSLRTHTAEPVPFAVAGKGVRAVLRTPFTEAAATDSDLHVEFGHELMEYFLHSAGA